MSRAPLGPLGTLAALLAARRAVPLALVLAAAMTAEWLEARSPAWVAIDVALFAVFCLVVPYAWRRACTGRAGLAWIGGTIVYLAIVMAIVYGFGLALPRALSLGYSYVLDASGLPVVAALFAVGGWALGRDIELEAGIAAERDRAGRLAIEAERAELLALRANLDPHFLFNTLNAIAEWCREDPLVAEKATLELASMLRTMLEGIRAPSWPLDKELSLARALLELHAIRDRSRYAFRVDAPEPLPEARVPPMLLLPLVENAITHGPAAGHEGEVVLAVRAEDARLVVEIENPGRYAGRRAGGQGIAMVERRLALAYGDAARLELRGEGARTRAALTLPLDLAAELA
ncbi:MAG TPA: histidine kinase [Sandaracinaceae bacterium]